MWPIDSCIITMGLNVYSLKKRTGTSIPIIHIPMLKLSTWHYNLGHENWRYNRDGRPRSVRSHFLFLRFDVKVDSLFMVDTIRILCVYFVHILMDPFKSYWTTYFIYTYLKTSYSFSSDPCTLFFIITKPVSFVIHIPILHFFSCRVNPYLYSVSWTPSRRSLLRPLNLSCQKVYSKTEGNR